MTGSVKIKTSEYRQYAEQIEYILGGATAKDFYILFKGKFNLDSEEKEFSYKISVPIGNEKFYEIKKMNRLLIKEILLKNRLKKFIKK